MPVSVEAVDAHVLDAELRTPFSFGDVRITEQPQLFVRAEVAVNGTICRGIAAEGLSPLWFLKDTPFGAGLDAMLDVATETCATARRLAPAPTAFEFWRRLHREQASWGEDRYPALLWGWGVSLLERAVVDAVCHAAGEPFARALRDGTLGVRLGALHDDLAGTSPAELLPDSPRQSVVARHTVGLDDPLTDADLDGGERLDDGLPETLTEYVRANGLTRFKVKVSGEPTADVARLERVADAIERERGAEYAVTLDANEGFSDATSVRTFWERVRSTAALETFRENVLFVEQPLPRDRALSDDAGAVLSAWDDRPPVVIDESDDRPGSLARALECGYDGTSYKSVKGVFKGVANACLLAHLNRRGERRYVLSAEDAANVGPVALLQDSAVAASLGVDHAERNGHHYFEGLTMLPEDLQERTLGTHDDLYARHERGFPAVDVTDGRMRLDSVVAAPFGYGIDIDPARFTPLAEWEWEGA